VESLLRFDVKLAGGETVLRGIGTVEKAVSEHESPDRPGMLLRFGGLDAGSHLLLESLGLPLRLPTLRTNGTGDPESRLFASPRSTPIRVPPPPPVDADETTPAPGDEEAGISLRVPAPPTAAGLWVQPPADEADAFNDEVTAPILKSLRTLSSDRTDFGPPPTEGEPGSPEGEHESPPQPASAEPSEDELPDITPTEGDITAVQARPDEPPMPQAEPAEDPSLEVAPSKADITAVSSPPPPPLRLPAGNEILVRGPAPPPGPTPNGTAIPVPERGPVREQPSLPPPRPRTGPVIAVDFGASRTAAARWNRGALEIATSSDDDTSLASAFSLHRDGRELVGREAQGQLVQNSENTVPAPKRLLGRAFQSALVREWRRSVPYALVEGPDGEAALELGGHLHSVPALCARVMSEAVSWAEVRSGLEFPRAVLTVPATFTALQRRAVRDAGEAAGLTVERLVNESTAVSLAFSRVRPAPQRVLVYKLGGGSFEAAVVEVQGEGRVRVLASGGDTLLGGLDFDAALGSVLVRHFESQQGPSFKADRPIFSRLLDAAERAKVALTTRPAYNVAVPYLHISPTEMVDFDLTLTREDLERLTGDLVERTMKITADVVRAAGLRPSDLGETLAAGGQSRMPLVRERLRQFVGREVFAGISPEDGALTGAAMLAEGLESRSRHPPEAREIATASIGIGLPGGRFRSIVERGEPLPCKLSHLLATTKDSQTYLDVVVLQGENERALDNELLGTFRVDGLPRAARGSVNVPLIFRVSADGLLQVSTRLEMSDHETQLTLSLRDTPEDLVTMLDEQPRTAPPPRRGVWKAVQRLFNT
jgi:molecular chaperone DnaK